MGELENIINQAAVHASKAKAQAVSMFDFEWAREKIMWGAEKKGMFITQEEKEATASRSWPCSSRYVHTWLRSSPQDYHHASGSGIGIDHASTKDGQVFPGSR